MLSPQQQDFVLARQWKYHIGVHPADLALDPPESYLFIQDVLILFCAIVWAISYVELILLTLKDRRSPMPLLVYPFNLAYELYYGIMIPQSPIGQFAFIMGWFVIDVIWLAATIYVTPRQERKRWLYIILAGSLVLLGVYHFTHLYLSADLQQAAYWFGMFTLFMDIVGVFSVMYKHGNSKGLNKRLGVLWFIGIGLAQAVFLWRYLNVPKNWAYVMSPASQLVWSLSWVLSGVDAATPTFMYWNRKRKRV